jgi:hypothetical protein
MTRPLPPTNFRLGSKDQPLQICWQKSVTTSVKEYKIRWKPLAPQNPDELELIGIFKTEEDTVEWDNAQCIFWPIFVHFRIKLKIELFKNPIYIPNYYDHGGHKNNFLNIIFFFFLNVAKVEANF